MAKNKQIERDEVLKPCLNACDNMLRQDIILQYRRLDAFDYGHIVGSPDIEIQFVKDNTLWLILAECKKPKGGVLSKKQIEYKNRYNGLKNVVYMVIKSKEELSELVEKLTWFYKNILDKI